MHCVASLRFSPDYNWATFPFKDPTTGQISEIEKAIPQDDRCLEDIRRGVGIPSNCEVLPHAIGGDEVLTDIHGRRFQVLKLYEPGNEELPPLGISISQLSRRGNVKETLQFDVLHISDPRERIRQASNFDPIEPLLLAKETFHEGLTALHSLAKRGILRFSEAGFQHEEIFSRASLVGKDNRIAKDMLTNWLAKNSVMVTNWGQGSAKSVSRLLEEFRAGEIRSISREYGKIYLEMNVCLLWVTDPSNSLRLIETGQTFQDGRERPFRQRLDFGGLPAEKMGMLNGIFETPQQCARRAITEELGIVAPSRCRDIRQTDTISVVKPCDDFPGEHVFARLKFFPFYVTLSPEQMRPYYEESGKLLYSRFDWIPNVSNPREYLRERIAA